VEGYKKQKTKQGVDERLGRNGRGVQDERLRWGVRSVIEERLEGGWQRWSR
jgi:hypothetical protein